MPTDIKLQRCIIARKFVLNARKTLISSTLECGKRNLDSALSTVENAIADLEMAHRELISAKNGTGLTTSERVGQRLDRIEADSRTLPREEQHWSVYALDKNKLRQLIPVSSETEVYKLIDNLRIAGYTDFEAVAPGEVPTAIKYSKTR